MAIGGKDSGVLGGPEGGVDVPEETAGAERETGKVTIGGRVGGVLEGTTRGADAPETDVEALAEEK